MTNNYTPTGKTYHIKTVEDFLKLSPEQFELAVEDFKEWKVVYEAFRDAGKMAESLGYGPDAIILPDYFEWIDDGIVGGKPSISVESDGD